MSRRRQISTVGFTLRLILAVWLFLSVISMALLGVGHTAATWCSRYSVPDNPTCRFVEHLLVIEGQ